MKTEELDRLGKPYRIYAEVLEEEALRQFTEAMSMDCTIKGALMPDAHTGYTLPIGAVVATSGMVFPSFVGYDIGCGMCALCLPHADPAKVEAHKEEIFNQLYETIPVGFKINDQPIPYSAALLTEQGKQIAEKKQYSRALGSLGGGNHFIEIGRDERDRTWAIIHSGSRGVGHGIASHYIALAHPEGKCKEGCYGFDVQSQNGMDYLQDQAWCLEFALANRREMMRRVVAALNAVLDTPHKPDYFGLINRNHNHAIAWQIDGVNSIVHRKGAVVATSGMLGVIPGNMRDGSFIVRGKGNAESLYSSSHGAGRVLGRREAKRRIALEDFIATMAGIQAKVDESTIDESPVAYKNIFDVMAQQKDLVDILFHITPVINIKG